MTRKAFCYRFVGLLSIGLLSIGPSKAFSSTSQNGQELTGSLKKGGKKDFTFSGEGEG